MDYQKKYIYLDSAASASSTEFNVVDKFANPNSIHDAGRDSFSALENSREYIAKSIGAKRPSEIIFTSGATESNNTAIFGIARAVAKNKGIRKNAFCGKAHPRIIISSIEHESVLLSALALKEEGFDVVLCPVDKFGFLKFDKFVELLNSDTVLVSIQHSNTEIGIIQNLKKYIDISREHGAYFHSDFVGSYGRIPFSVSQLGIDSISFAGHKIGTAKGIGGLYLRHSTPCLPLIYGSGQENGVRGGTQNVAMAMSLQKATEHCIKNMDSNYKHFRKLQDYLVESLSSFSKIRFTQDLKNRKSDYLPNIVHLLYEGFSSETLILHYGKYNISLSGGPACSASDKEPSNVLKSIGTDKSLINGALRLSFTQDTSIDNLKEFVRATQDLFKC